MLVNVTENLTRGGGGGAVGHFTRGDKASVSVRLRSKKSDNGGGKKRNRHSGDFSFFSANKNNNNNNNNASAVEETSNDDDKKKEGDWAYITFHNGVPTVQDIQTNVGPVSQREPVSVPPQQPKPVKVVTREVPGVLPLRPRSTYGGGPQPQQLMAAGKRTSGDFSMYPPISRVTPAAVAMKSNNVVMRNKNNLHHMRSKSHQVIKEEETGDRGGSRKHVTQVMVGQQQQRPNVMYGRGGEQTGPSAAMAGGVAKRCSGEFDYGRINGHRRSGDFSLLLDSPSEEAEASVVRVQVRNARPKSTIISPEKKILRSPDIVGDLGDKGSPRRSYTPKRETSPNKNVVVATRQTGLGRRAVTQINIQQNKKNSYNSAMCKSQENLVKDKEDTEEEEDFDASLEKKSTVKKGLLWQQRDKFFSQWKERYFILTPDYLQCFKKGTSRITEMGDFIFKMKLNEVEEVELLDKRGYLVVSVTLSSRGEGKIYLRKTEGIRDWYNSLKECVRDSKKRRTDRTSGGFWATKQLTDSSSIEKWLLARKKIGTQYAYLDSSSSDAKKSNESNGDGLQQQSKSSRSEITLDELSDLYRSEEAEKEAEQAAKRLLVNSSTTNVHVNSATPPPVVRMRSREELRGNSKQTKKINRLSLMSDIGLPDFGGQDLGIDLEKGIFLRKTNKVKCDNDSNDSGNNSMNTNGSVGSSNSSHSNPRDSHREERLETHLEADQSEDDDEAGFDGDESEATKFRGTATNVEASSGGAAAAARKSSYPMHPNNNLSRRSHMPQGLQITHV